MQMDSRQGGPLTGVVRVIVSGSFAWGPFAAWEKGAWFARVRWSETGPGVAKGAWPAFWQMQFPAASFSVGTAALQFLEQNQYDDAHSHGEDRQHDNQLLAIHTYIPST